MADDVFVEIQGLPELQKLLGRITDEDVLREVTKKVGEFVRGKMKKYPDYYYVSRKEAYGQTFQSDRQRRWFFANMGDQRLGMLRAHYIRTNRLSNAWELVDYGKGDMALQNETPYVGLVQGPKQSRMMYLRGWKTFEQVRFENADRIQTTAEEAFNAAVHRYIGRA